MADSGYLYRRCITLRNGKVICKPPGQVFRFKANDNYKPKAPDKPKEPEKPKGEGES